jgi:photosystem II stability/assembly factor-like uncharacterized protein
MNVRVPIVLAAILALTACGRPEAPDANRPGQPTAAGPERPRDLTYYGLDVVDARTAFVFGLREGRSDSVVLKTTDAGASWSAVLQAPGREVVGLDFVDASNGAVLTDEGAVFVTADGGRTWEAAGGPGAFAKGAGFAGAAPEFRGVFFLDEANGWAVGARDAVPTDRAGRGGVRPVAARTADGGRTWAEGRIPAEAPGVALSRAFFVDARTGWAAGGDIDDDVPGGLLLATEDGGATWRPAGADLRQKPTDVCFVDHRRGWLVGQTEDQETSRAGPSEILTSEDGGATWRTQAKVPASLYAVRFADASNGWAVGDAALIYHTRDGGATWTEQGAGIDMSGRPFEAPELPEVAEELPVFFGFVLATPGRGWAAADDGVYSFRRE